MLPKFIKDSWIALRPFSLTLAAGATTLGIVAAYREGLLFKGDAFFDLLKIALVTVAGLLTQAGVNGSYDWVANKNSIGSNVNAENNQNR